MCTCIAIARWEFDKTQSNSNLDKVISSSCTISAMYMYTIEQTQQFAHELN